MATMKDIIQSPLLLALVTGGLLYISAFSLVYLKKAYDHCLELGITRKELSNVIKSSLIFSIVPSLSIVVGLFVLIAVLGSVWAWWRLSVIGSLSYETMISSSIAQVLGGLVGIGTLVCAFCLGPFIQFFDGHFSQKVLKYKPVKE